MMNSINKFLNFDEVSVSVLLSIIACVLVYVIIVEIHMIKDNNTTINQMLKNSVANANQMIKDTSTTTNKMIKYIDNNVDEYINEYINDDDITNCIAAVEKEFNTDIIILIDEFWDDKHKNLVDNIIDIDNNEKFIERLFNIAMKSKCDTLSLLVYTDGGTIFTSDMIIELLLTLNKTVNIYVPLYAYSAGTMIALCADNLYLGQSSILGPVDPQISFTTANNCSEDEASSKCLMDMLKEKEELEDIFYIKALESKALHQDNIDNLNKIMDIKHKYLSKNMRSSLITEFASGKHPHHKPFSKNKIESLGIKVADVIPNSINELVIKFIEYKNKFTKNNSSDDK